MMIDGEKKTITIEIPETYNGRCNSKCPMLHEYDASYYCVLDLTEKGCIYNVPGPDCPRYIDKNSVKLLCIVCDKNPRKDGYTMCDECLEINDLHRRKVNER